VDFDRYGCNLDSWGTNGVFQRERLALPPSPPPPRYQVCLGAKKISIGVDDRNPDLDRVLGRYGARCWCFITAWNPESRLRPGWRNRGSQRILLQQLTRSGLVFLQGYGVGENWPREPSFLVMDIMIRDAIKLGSRFRQNAMLFGEVGGAARLVWCR
jgi:hypothetical protein